MVTCRYLRVPPKAPTGMRKYIGARLYEMKTRGLVASVDYRDLFVRGTWAYHVFLDFGVTVYAPHFVVGHMPTEGVQGPKPVLWLYANFDGKNLPADTPQAFEAALGEFLHSRGRY